MKTVRTALLVTIVAAVYLGAVRVHVQTVSVGAPPAVVDQVMQVEEAFRVGKLRDDVAALDRVLNSAFVETNQNGNSRTKSEIIELFETFPIDDLRTESAAVRVAGSTAMVTGTQVEIRGPYAEHMLFTRVYVNDGSRWTLFASSQFRDPRVANESLVR